MKNKIVRFIVYFVVMTASLYLAYTLLDMNKDIASENAKENLLLAALVGAGASATLVFLPSLFRKPKG